MKFSIPIKTFSEQNESKHWAAQHRRHSKQREATAWVWLGNGGVKFAKSVTFPVIVKMTRVAPRKLDNHDNLRVSLKPIVDELTNRIGLANDRDSRISFEYAQRKGQVREYAVEVEISSQ